MKKIKVELNEWEVCELIRVWLKGSRKKADPDTINRCLKRVDELNKIRIELLDWKPYD